LSKIQEEMRHSSSAQVAAEGQVQALNLRNKQLDMQLQRQTELVLETRGQVEVLERRLIELSRSHSDCQEKLMAASLELEAANKRVADLQVAAQRAYCFALFFGLGSLPKSNA
jgi:chromosome segregation ATPase